MTSAFGWTMSGSWSEMLLWSDGWWFDRPGARRCVCALTCVPGKETSRPAAGTDRLSASDL